MNALITGGTRGVGKATADILREKGWNVRAWGWYAYDVRGKWKENREKLELLRRTTDWKPDALILSAGGWFSQKEDTHEIGYYHSQMDYFYGHWNLMHYYQNDLSERGGVVIGVASTRAFIGGVETGPYSVAKAALVAMIQGYAREYGHGVRFNCVCPGLTDTDMGAEVVRTGGAKPGALMNSPERVARVIVDLIEDGKSNGRIVRVVEGEEISDAKWTW